MAVLERPAHVPADRVVDFDIFDFPVEEVDYQQALKAQLADGKPDLLWTPRNGGHWIMTRFDGIATVLADSDHFSSRHITVPPDTSGRPPLVPLQLDPPDHTPYRALLQQTLSPKAVGALGEAARALAIELIEGFKADGQCEFISAFAQHLPIAIFMNIVGLPESDRPMLTEMAERALRGDDSAERTQAAIDIGAYGMRKVMERRAHPGSDLISRIATAEVDGQPIGDQQLAGLVTLLLLGGLDTVASSLGFFAQFLARHPEHRRQLVEHPELIPNAVEELLRRFPIAILARQVRSDMPYDGVTLHAGDMVLAPTPLSGLDETRFADPLSVDFNRERPGLNATFGGGAHRCPGSMLARTELRVFLEEWLKRIPDFAIAPGADVKVSARSVATITALPLVWSTD